MPTIFGYHDVKDKDHWLASPKREESFGPLGVTSIRTFVDPGNPTRVGVLMDVPDMDALNAAMQDESAGAAMEHDGVVAESLDGAPVAAVSKFLGEATNNQAEYEGLLAALEFARSKGYTRLRILSDSELLVR